jgi:hypothetical protein
MSTCFFCDFTLFFSPGHENHVHQNQNPKSPAMGLKNPSVQVCSPQRYLLRLAQNLAKKPMFVMLKRMLSCEPSTAVCRHCLETILPNSCASMNDWDHPPMPESIQLT